MPLTRYLILIIYCLINSQVLFADVLLLKNGDRVTGKVSSMKQNKLFFHTEYAELAVPWQDIAQLESTEKLTLELSDNSLLKGVLIRTENESATIQLAELSKHLPIKMDDIKAINPPIVTDEPRLSGGINLGGSKTSGNTDAQTIHADASLVAQFGKDKFTALAEYNQAANNQAESANNFHALGKYDHFINPDWYGFLYTDFSKDRFQDLNFRSAFGAGIGHQFWETDQSFLSVELGAAYVIEDYKAAEDREFVSGLWNVNYHYWIFEDRLQFFHNHDGLVSLEEISDVLIRTRTGFKYPIYKGFNLLTQFDLDYDNKPAEGKKSTDTRYIVGLGYSWN